MTSIFDHEPNIGASTAEPSLRDIVIKYYGEWFSSDKQERLTKAYFDKLCLDYESDKDMVIET